MRVRGWRLWGLVLGMAVVAACGSRGRLRYGSLHPLERRIEYRPAVEWFSLPNGLTVVLAPDDRANLVSVDVRYLVGAAEDPSGKSGLAHLVEHLMFNQRNEPGGPTLDDRLTAATLSFNARTDWDATHYADLALAGNLDRLLAIEALRMSMGCRGIDELTFERERSVVLQEILQRGSGGFLDEVRERLFGASHAYTRSIGGRDVAGMTLADVCSFVDTYYAPNRAILVVGGRIDADRASAVIPRLFGSTRHRATAPRTPVEPVVLSGGSREIVGDRETARAMVFFPAAPWGTSEAIADNLLDRLVADRLESFDRRERWITGSSTGRVGGMRAGARYFALDVADPVRLDDAVQQIYRITEELTGADLDFPLSAAANQRQAELLSGFESVIHRGAWCADYVQFTKHGEFHLHELLGLKDIDIERMRARARRLIPGSSYVIRVLPNKDHARRGGAVPREAAERIDLPVWSAPVDPAEAERPLSQPVVRPSALSEFQLDNGLHVVMNPDFTQPVFEARMVFPVGSTGAEPKRAAVAFAAARLLEHDNDRSYSPRDAVVLNWVLQLGARLSTQVGEHTTFRIRGASTYADWHVWRLYSLLQGGIYRDIGVNWLRDAAAEAAGHHDRNRGWSRALHEALFGRDHPYARGGYDLADGADLRVKDLDQFRDTYYRLNGATLLIVGRFDTGVMRKTVTELFGDWDSSPAPSPPPVPSIRAAAGPAWIAYADPEASQVRITHVFVATSPRASSRAARAIVAQMVRGRLEKARAGLGATYGFTVSYDLTNAGDWLQIDGWVDPDRAGQVMRSILADLDGMRTGDESIAADFVRARRVILTRSLADPGQSGLEADRLEDAVVHHLELDAAATLPVEIASTTLAQARAVIAQDLQPERMIALLSGQPADTAAAFAENGVTNVRTVAAAPGP